MDKLINKDCRYFESSCTFSIRNEDKSCYGICNVYREWNMKITNYLDKFDFEPFDENKAIAELGTMQTATERLNFWLNNYYRPLYDRFDFSFTKMIKDVIDYQNSLKYGDSYVLITNVSMPQIIFDKFFEKDINTAEYSFWFLKFNANIAFECLLVRDNWEEKLKSKMRLECIEKELNRLQKEEEKADGLFRNGDIEDIYNNYSLREYNTEYNKYQKEIELLRLKIGYYETYKIESMASTMLLDLYARHIYLKDYLQKEHNKIKRNQDALYEITVFFDGTLKDLSNYKSYVDAISNHGYYLMNHSKVYRPELAFLLSEEKLVGRTHRGKQTEIINGFDYLKSYVDGYKEGEEYFKQNIRVDTSIIYSPNVTSYLSDLHENYYHTNCIVDGKGWNVVREKFPITINHAKIREYGYYSGIVNKVDELRNQYPNQFKDFEICEKENEVEIKKEQIIDTLFNMKPDFIQPLFDVIKDFFSIEHQLKLREILDKGNNSSEKLIFKDNGNRLSDTFKKLIDHDILIGIQKQELIYWIMNNFKFTHNGNVKDYLYDTVEKIISRNDYPCKKPIIEIKNGQIQKIEQPTNKKYKKY